MHQTYQFSSKGISGSSPRLWMSLYHHLGMHELDWYWNVTSLFYKLLYSLLFKWLSSILINLYSSIHTYYVLQIKQINIMSYHGTNSLHWREGFWVLCNLFIYSFIYLFIYLSIYLFSKRWGSVNQFLLFFFHFFPCLQNCNQTGYI